MSKDVPALIQPDDEESSGDEFSVCCPYVRKKQSEAIQLRSCLIRGSVLSRSFVRLNYFSKKSVPDTEFPGLRDQSINVIWQKRCNLSFE